MKKFSIRRTFTILLAMAILVTSFYVPDGSASAAAKSVKSIKLKIGAKNVTKKTFHMIKGRTRKLTVTVKPASSKKAVTYRSNNSKIVSVSKKGKLTAKKIGTAKITVKVTGKNGKSKKTWVKIKVYKKKTAKVPKDETDSGNTDISGKRDTPSTPDTPNVPSKPDVPGTPGSSGGWSTGYWPTYPSGTSGGQTADTIIDTQAKLLAALRKQPSEVIFQTDKEVTVRIPEETYNETTLIVDAPHATIENAAVYKKILIKAIKPNTWVEKAKGNIIDIVAPKARVQIADGAKADIQVNEGAKEVKIDNEGDIGKFSLSAKATILIGGNRQKHIPLTVDENGKDATVNTSVPLDVTAAAAIVLQLHSGAERTSTIQVSNASAMPTIVAAVVGYLQVTNIQTGRADDVLVTMPSPGDPGFETAASEEKGSITGIVKSITAGAGENPTATAVAGATVNVIPYERGVLESDLESAIRAAVSQNKCYTENTSENGKYTVKDIPRGNYVIVVKAAGLQTYLYTIVLNEELKQMDTITMVPPTGGAGKIEGVIRNALTKEPVKETMKLYLRKGAGTVAGEAFRVAETDADGGYQFADLPTGVYTIRVVDERPSAEGVDNYINVAFHVAVLAGITIRQDMTITNAISDDQLRFVLRWGKESDGAAKDLDSHLVGPKASGDGLFHTYFIKRFYSEDGERYAYLDVDHINWEGPETTTVYKKTDGVYRFYVYDYSERYEPDSEKLAASQAKVDIYLGGRLLASYNVPDKAGTLWDVCTYDAAKGILTPINEIYNYPKDCDCGNIGLVDGIKKNLSELINTYKGKEILHFGAEAAAGVSEELAKAEEIWKSSTDFATVLSCLVALNQHLQVLFDSTCISEEEGVTFKGRRKCYIWRHNDNGYSEIDLQGDEENLPADLAIQPDSKNANCKLEDTDLEGFQKKVIVTDSVTKAIETYYIKYQKYVPNFNISEITATGNRNIRWKTSSIQKDGKEINVLSITGSALKLVDPEFTFYSSGEIGITPNYNPLSDPANPEYVGTLAPRTENGDETLYYVTYDSLLEPDRVTDTPNNIYSWYIEHGGSTGGVNCIHIYGAESTLTTGAALEFNDPEVESEYEQLDDNADYIGKFTVTCSGTDISKVYFVKYHEGKPELTLISVWEEKNDISLLEPTKDNEGNKIYNLEGNQQGLGDKASFGFNAANVSVARIESVGSMDADWNYRLYVTYDNEEETIYIKYTQRT